MSSTELKELEKTLTLGDYQRDGDERTPYEREQARIIHSSSFRRLQGKTQVTGADEGDFHRTRLTHTLEVCQIGCGIAARIQRNFIKYDESLSPYINDAYNSFRTVTASACYAHDLGHPPFGHGGEKALYSLMKDKGGFEGNAQTLRILTKLEKYHETAGINPTRRLLLAVLKYPVSYEAAISGGHAASLPPKCRYGGETDAVEHALEIFSESDRNKFQDFSVKGNVVKPLYKSFDASVMEAADDIANSSHDFEDMIARRLILPKDLKDSISPIFMNSGYKNWLGPDLFIDRGEKFDDIYYDSKKRKKFVGGISALLLNSLKIEEVQGFTHPLLKYNAAFSDEAKSLIKLLKDKVLMELVVNAPEVQMLEIRGQYVIKKIFEAFSDSPEKLIKNWTLHREESGSKERGICDYISGMTDSFAAKIYNRLYSPGTGSSKDEI